jgi:hypothetical protein
VVSVSSVENTPVPFVAQCGFASTIEGNRVTIADQRRKLELVASVARAVWPDTV